MVAKRDATLQDSVSPHVKVKLIDIVNVKPRDADRPLRW